MPKLWSQTLEAHRREIRDAILDTTARIVAQHGLLSVTMSRIAEETDIGRATLYKYFPDVEAILRSWHGREIASHLEQLSQARDQAGSPMERLHAVLEAYALISRGAQGHGDAHLAAFLHRDEQVAQAERQLRDMIRDLLSEGLREGEVRDDISPAELASYCVYSLGAARVAPSRAAVHRLVELTLAGVRASR